MTKHLANWSNKKLDDLGFVGRGKSKHRPRNAPELYDGPYPFIQTADVMRSEFYITSYSQTYSEIGLAQSKLWHKDTLCISIAGENTAESAILTFTACFPDSIIGFVADPDKADVRFIKYYLDTIKTRIKSVTKGATQDNLSLEKLLSFEILAPPVVAQRRIASILSAYDDLIENNTRRIKILEQMAQAIYHEWFVEFRAPGVKLRKATPEEQKVARKDRFPAGWEIGSFSGIATIARDNINPMAYPDEIFAHYSIPAFDEGQMPAIETGESIRSNKYLVPHNCVLLSKINPRIPRIWLPFPSDEHRPITSTEFLVLLPKQEINRGYLLAACSMPAFLDSFAGLALGTSTSHQRVKPDDLLGLHIPIPEMTTVKQYGDLVAPMLSMAHTLRLKNANLRQTRDLLLPRLVEGEIDV